MITSDLKARWNEIVEAASETLNEVVMAIVDDPPDVSINPRQRAFDPLWAGRYEAIKDLNVVTRSRRLSDTSEYVDRYPMCGFFLMGVAPQPMPDGEEAFVASLGCLVAVEAETFTIGMYELYEIHYAIRSILNLDKSLGEISKRGGVVLDLIWRGMSDPSMDYETLQNPFISVVSNFDVFFVEALHKCTNPTGS